MSGRVRRWVDINVMQMGTILCINGLFYKWVEVAAAGLRLF